jgi:hypothetical protein
MAPTSAAMVANAPAARPATPLPAARHIRRYCCRRGKLRITTTGRLRHMSTCASRAFARSSATSAARAAALVRARGLATGGSDRARPRSSQFVRGRLELRQTASDLSHLLSDLDRRVVSDTDGQQPQRRSRSSSASIAAASPSDRSAPTSSSPKASSTSSPRPPAPLTEPPPAERAVMIAPPPRRAARPVDGPVTGA